MMEPSDMTEYLKKKKFTEELLANAAKESANKIIQEASKEPTQQIITKTSNAEFVVMADTDIIGMNERNIHGIISNGGELPLSDTMSIACVRVSKTKINIQIRIYQKGMAPKKQSYVRTKTKVVKEEVEKPAEIPETKTNTKKKKMW